MRSKCKDKKYTVVEVGVGVAVLGVNTYLHIEAILLYE